VPVENNVVIVRPKHDQATEIFSDKMAIDAVNLARQKLYNVSDLYDEKAIRDVFTGTIITQNPLIVFTFSHGNVDALISDDGTTPFLDKANTYLTNNRIFYSFGCKVGQELAPAAIDIGCRAYLTWDEVAIVTVWADTLEPLEGFKEVLVYKPVRLLDGLTVQQVHNETMQEYEKWIAYWDERDPAVADTLRWDRDHFKLYGTGESRVTLSTAILMGVTDIILVTFVILWTILNIVRSIKPLLRR